MTQFPCRLHVGVLALQGAFSEHLQLLHRAYQKLETLSDGQVEWSCSEIRTPQELARCDALIIPGGESTTIALVAARSEMMEPLREFVKVHRKPVWGTCAGLVLLAEAANRTKKGGQELIGGLDVRVNRNHYGRQVESFESDLRLPFLESTHAQEDLSMENLPFKGIFIRAPVVEKVLPPRRGTQAEEEHVPDTIIAPSKKSDTHAVAWSEDAEVEVLGILPGRAKGTSVEAEGTETGDIVAVRQGNCFGTSFHPELTNDARIHLWWLDQVRRMLYGNSAS